MWISRYSACIFAIVRATYYTLYKFSGANFTAAFLYRWTRAWPCLTNLTKLSRLVLKRLCLVESMPEVQFNFTVNALPITLFRRGPKRPCAVAPRAGSLHSAAVQPSWASAGIWSTDSLHRLLAARLTSWLLEWTLPGTSGPPRPAAPMPSEPGPNFTMIKSSTFIDIHNIFARCWQQNISIKLC